MAGLTNPAGSETFWFSYDSIQPIVISVVPSIPLTQYINVVTLNQTVFTVTFGEVRPVWLHGCVTVLLCCCVQTALHGFR